MTRITEQDLQNAFELKLKALTKAAPAYYTTSKLEEVRENWPSDKLRQKCCEVWINEKVLSLNSRSGFGAVGHPDAHAVHLSPDAEDEPLGAAVKEVLERSWELTLRDLQAEVRSRGRDEIGAIYSEWLSGFMLRHGYRTKKALFKNMLHCTITCRAGALSMSPSNHDRLDGWSGEGLAADSDVIVPESSSSESIGAALRLCFSRCLDTYGKKP